MSGAFDDAYDWRDFESLDDYIDFRLQESIESGGMYDIPDETIKEWADIFIDQHMWDDLQGWMDWDDDQMADFFDWWREMYENA